MVGSSFLFELEGRVAGSESEGEHWEGVMFPRGRAPVDRPSDGYCMPKETR